MRGGHCRGHWSGTQTALALRSGEAELGGGRPAKDISQGVGLRSLAADAGIDLELQLCTAATFAMGMTRRLGWWNM